MARFRRLKETVRALLADSGWAVHAESGLAPMDAQGLVGPLFSLLLDPDEAVRWRAVTALGAVTARLADQDMERARVVMRRFLWHMNEESGNVGWGIPESMGEAMARHPRLAEEYHKKLASYVQCPDCLGDDNYMDHPPLRQATYWGLARLAQVRPGLARHAADELLAALEGEESPASAALACWAVGLLRDERAVPALRGLAGREDAVEIFRDGALERTSLGALAAEALRAMDKE